MAGHLMVVKEAVEQSVGGELADDDLMLLARGGQRDAFDRLVRRYQERTLRTATRYLGDPSAAQEAAQRAFIELYRYLPRYQARGRFAQLLFRVLLNQCRMLCRRRKQQRALGERLPWEPPREVRLAEQELLARERRHDVERGLAVFSEKLREVVVLRFSADLAYEEISATLAIPVGTVKSRLAAGMTRLREILEEER